MPRLVLCVVTAACVETLVGCDLREAYRRNAEIAARAGGQELSVAQLGQIVAHGKHVPLRLDVVERMAGLWVDYSLVVQRLAEGDSLLDSLTVVNAMWSDKQALIVGDYHAQLVSDRLALDGNTVDSAYNAGVDRLIYHILVRTAPEFTSSDFETARAKADRLREIAATGSAGWRRANRENEDDQSRVLGGSLGMISRGGQVPEFEEVAFELEPGGLSPITQSEYGYHVIWRPSLSEAWDEFEAGLRSRIEVQLNAQITRELELGREISVHSNGPDLMRAAVEEPRQSSGSSRTIGTYLGGRFTVGDFVRWLQVLPIEYRAGLNEAGDEQLIQFARGLMRNEVLEIEALEAGYRLQPDGYTVLRETLSQDLDVLRRAMALDSVFAESDPGESRSSAAAEVVLQYLAAVTNDLAQMVVVRPALADLLRADADWEVRAAGVTRALARGAETRASLSDSAGQAPEN